MSSGPFNPRSRDEGGPRAGEPRPVSEGDQPARRSKPIRFDRVPSSSRVEQVAAALRGRGFDVTVVPDGPSARSEVLARLSPKDEVLEAHSQTLHEVGLTGPAAPEGAYRRLRPALDELAKQGRRDEKRRLGASPDVVLGSVQAVTYAGELVVASGSGSQIGPYSYGAGRVIWVVGAQKIVRDIPAAFRRIEEYALPREDARVRSRGGAGSSINKLLIFRREHQPHRSLVVLVNAPLGV